MISNFNKNQSLAIESPLGQTLVIAGAGSGKTSVLTNRVAHLIKNLSFKPYEILAITFTNKAANEMKERLKLLVDDKFNWIGTFHSICLRILREDIDAINKQKDFIILDDEDQLTIVKEFIHNHQININDFPYKVCVSHIAKFKNENMELDDLLNEKNWKYFGFKNLNQAVTNRRIINHYINYCQQNNCLDFNDLLNFAIKVLANQQVREKWQKKFKYILIDEFQDTNDIQYELIKILSQKHNNIFAVGDPDQMIYSWRGANENIINIFKKDFNNANIIILNENYRSTQEILNASNYLIKNNLNRIDKDLISFKNGPKPIYYLADSQEDESIWVANRINELREKGYRLKDIAILYRSNYLSRNIEETLFSNGIHYVLYGGVKFYNRKEIKDMIAYLRAIYYRDDLFIKRIINTPRRGISQQTIDIINDFSEVNNISFYDSLLKCEECNLNSTAKNSIKKFIMLLDECYSENILNALDNILNIASYKEYLEVNEQIDRLTNIDELKNSIIKYQNENKDNNFNDYLQEVSLYSSIDDAKNEDAVNLMTIHIAKGLEFKNVFIIGMNENIFPSKKSLDSGYKAIEEERRVAYVAITRAMENLFLSSFQGFNPISRENNKKSRFIDEISSNNYELAKIKYNRINNTNIDDQWFDSKKIFNAKEQYSNQKNEFKIGDRIVHSIFGEGIIVGVLEENIDVSFNKPHGIKTLIANHNAIKRVRN